MTIMLFTVNVYITLGAAFFLGGGYLLISVLLKSKLKRSGEKSLQANEARYKFANEALSGIKTTRVLGIEPYFLRKYGAQSYLFSQYYIFSRMASELPRYLLEALAFGGIVLFIVVQLALGQQMDALIPLVSLYAFAAYKMMPALYRLYNSVAQIHFFQAVLDKIYFDIVQEDDNEREDIFTKSPAPLSFVKDIQLRNVSFRYPGTSSDVFKGINVTIPRNAVIGFAGITGSGKTTLMDVLLGLLTPQEGELLVDGECVGKHNVRAWRKQIGYVPQEIYLSDDSIYSNIAFGVEEKDIDFEQVVRAAKLAAIDAFVQELPEAYNTVIGERGIRLSGGQRQRLGLARALYRDPGVLVLDEATSSLDGGTEDAVLSAIRNVLRTRTVLMIAHRLNTLKDCDVIYLMQNGKITDQGTYSELLTSNSIFREMAKAETHH